MEGKFNITAVPITIVSLVFGFINYHLENRISAFENTVEQHTINISEAIREQQHLKNRMDGFDIKFREIYKGAESSEYEEYLAMKTEVKKIKLILADQYQKLELLNRTIDQMRSFD
ncbi:MAG: hypothetical protein KDG50_15360 [Chromatiales bacterium]|nr:hypothetical protein [Chromatiales bacterium]